MKLILLFISSCFSLKLYKSNLPFLNESENSGLHYTNEHEGFTFSNSITFCLRFKYQRLFKDPKILLIQEPHANNNFLMLNAQYPHTWFHFGNVYYESARSNWILKDPVKNNFNIWYANKWQHLCISYSKLTSYISVVKVRNNKADFF